MSPGTANCVKSERARHALMRLDAVLPADVLPAGPGAETCRRVLLTGATGFLGRHVLRELLARDLEVICLVRAQDARQAQSRLEQALTEGYTQPSVWERARAVCGDTAQPRLGLGAAHDALAAGVDAVYHCAAEVSWVKSYARLRQTNVLAALEVIRFACQTRTKPITFTSSLATCFAREHHSVPGGSPVKDEGTDMLPWLEAMPLGYAQSKCVAEALLRQASQRGLPVTIVRAGLLAGDTLTGRSNPSDVLSALIEACVAQGIALDIDWQVDSLPVDYAARALVALSGERPAGLATYHLRHSRPRHWRELVLWLNLFGYPVRLLPVPAWNREIFAPDRKGGPLSSYRRFFIGPPRVRKGDRPFEAYTARAQAELDCRVSRAALEALGLEEPPLDSPLLRRYVEHYARIGTLPVQRWPAGAGGDRPEEGLCAAVAATLDDGTGARSKLLWEPLPFDASDGILNEIASLRSGSRVGMYRYRVRSERTPAAAPDLVVKVKARDSVLQALVAELAALCAPELGRSLRAFPQALGLVRSHLREPALYRDAPAAIARHMPRCYGVSADVAGGHWSVAMEHLAGDVFLDGASWSSADVDAAVDAAASIHSVWYGRDRQLQAQPWAAPEVAPSEIARMTRLWRQLCRFAAPRFSTWAGPGLRAWQRDLVANAPRWWRELQALPRTLIHNDFNPRNLALGRRAGRSTVCAVDWELARVGVPQHDLAELLCFVFPSGAGLEQLERWLELHRATLARHAAVEIARDGWRRGFVLALQHLLVERLPLYTLVHRFKAQSFLPGVVRNWARLYELGSKLQLGQSRPLPRRHGGVERLGAPLAEG